MWNWCTDLDSKPQWCNQTTFRLHLPAAEKGFMSWLNTFMEMCLLLQEVWWSLALTRALGSQLIAVQSQALQWGTQNARNQPWDTIADFPQYSLVVHTPPQLYDCKTAQTEHSHNPGVLSIQDSLASVLGRLSGPCAFPCCHNQCCVFGRSRLVTVL